MKGAEVVFFFFLERFLVGFGGGGDEDREADFLEESREIGMDLVMVRDNWGLGRAMVSLGRLRSMRDGGVVGAGEGGVVGVDRGLY